MKIVRLTVSDFKRIVAVDIHANGSTVTVSGRNGAGKTSVLDSIEAALGGGKYAPEEPIRKGQKKARVVVETEELVVTRTFSAKGSQLEVKAKDGSTYAGPQAMLDGLVGPISFDPLIFCRQDPKAQAATLRQLVGLDFAKEDAKRVARFDERTEVGRELRRISGALDKMPEPPAGTPDAEVSVAELVAEVERRQRVNAANNSRRSVLDGMRAEGVRLVAEVADAKARASALEAKLEALRANGVALRTEVDALADADVAEVQKRIAGAESVNAAVRAKIARETLAILFNTQTDVSEQLTKYIAQIDEVKASAAAGAKYPIEGLAVTDTGVMLDGVPFEQASQAQKLRASIAIGIALNPKLRVLLVRDAAVLDDDNLAMVAKMADDAGVQLWIERLAPSGGVEVVIEDGQVAEDGTARPAEVSDAG